MISNVSNVSQENYPSSDRYGITLSLLCGIHCAISPIIYLLAPTLVASWWSAKSVHIVAALVIVPIAIYALSRGLTRHKNKWPSILGYSGSFLIILALLPMWGYLSPLLFTWTDGFFIDASQVGTQLCCPTISKGLNGGMIISLPWATIITFVGSILLCAGHLKNCMSFKCGINGCSDACQSA